MTDWKNRVVGYGEENPEQLLANPHNHRIHPKRQQDALKGSLDTLGYIQTVLVNRSTQHIVDGHLRVIMAMREGQKYIPVTYVELTPEEEAQALLSLDPIAAMAANDRDKVDELLRLVNTDNEDVIRHLADFAAENKLDWGQPEQVDAEPQIDRATELQKLWGTELGQLWKLGDHRLLIGDCTSLENRARLFGDKKAALGVTSPPYAVGKEYETEISFGEHLKLIEGVADRALEIIEPGGFFFVNFGEIAPQSHSGPLTGSKRQCIYPISKDYWRIFHEERGMDLYAQRIWYKPFNRLQQPFWSYHTSIPHYQEWEHIWTWRLPGGDGDKVHDWDISVYAVWDTRNESTNDKPLTRHVAAFPVGIPERAIKAHTDSGALVWEPFSGSGTTMLVSHNLGRICYGTELDPAYCAVILQRLADATGIQPELIDSRTVDNGDA